MKILSKMSKPGTARQLLLKTRRRLRSPGLPQTPLKMMRMGTFLERTVYKKDFEKFLRPQLQKYGALLCPGMALSSNQIKLDYSISIPLTEVWVGVTRRIDRNGKIII